ncbi:MAG TPA: gluconokinase [Gammaproteobacteria bacterium]|nr:gluconokinase [Gammaproteobacteria bacterium]
MDYILALDIGSTNIKAVAFDEAAMPAGDASIPCSFLINEQHRQWQEQDPVKIFEAVTHCAAEVQKRLRGKPVAVALSSAMHSLIALDKNDSPLTRCMSWADLRGSAVANALRDTSPGRDIYRKTGTPVHPMSPLIKIAWLRQRQPEVFGQAAMFLGIKEFIVARLFGRKLVDYSIASASGLFDIFNYDWYRPALDFAGVGAERLPAPVDSLHRLEGLDTKGASMMGIPSDTPWIIGASDGCLANLGALVFSEQDAVVTLGTSAALRRQTTQAVDDPLGRVFNYILHRGCYISGGASNNGGNLTQWFAKSLCAESDLEQLLAAVARVEPGAEGLLFLPFILGERAPLWDPDVTGAFLGVRAHHTRAHFLRAVLEGMLLNLHEIGRVLTAVAGPIPRLHLNGGLARSGIIAQMLADVFGVPVSINRSEEASARGAAVLALRALGRPADARTLLERQPAPQEFAPDAARHGIYREISARYRDSVAAYLRHMPTARIQVEN